MLHLSNYVAAILGKPAPVAVKRRESAEESWPDQGFTVKRCSSTYWFDNGVVLRRVIEQDDFPSDLACAECWIDYQVVSVADVDVQPRQKSFDNTCREAFWLAYHQP